MTEGPTQHMPPPPSAPPPGYGPMMGWQGARMPIPGNAGLRSTDESVKFAVRMVGAPRFGRLNR